MARSAAPGDSAFQVADPRRTPWTLPISRIAIERALIIFILLTAAGFGFAGIKKSLPLTREVDEGIFTVRAVEIAASGDLNPHWFGNPGSTIIYPLAAAYSGWHAVTDGGNIIPPDSDIRRNHEEDLDDYYYIGRSLTILYFVGAVFLTYLIGRRAFNPTVGLIAALFMAINPITIEHAQIVRTDTAGTFFGLLSLWLILRLYDIPSNTNRLLVGAGIGLAVSSRYFLVTLVPVLALAELLLLLRKRSKHHLELRDLAEPFIGPATALAAFALTTPYFFLDFDTARETIRAEARATHLGADGLSRTGNLRWYLTEAIPSALTIPVALLAFLGAGIALLRRQPPHLLCLLALAVFLAGISYSRLHWERWLIPMLPITAILAAFALHEFAMAARSRLSLPPAVATVAIAAVALALIISPTRDVVLHDIRAASPTTNIAARDWMIDNIPPDTRIAGELYTAPLQGTDFRYSQEFSLFQSTTLEAYEAQDVEYVLASSNIYDRYYTEPERYATIIERYDALFAHELVMEFQPSNTRGGPTIGVYRLSASD